MDEDAVPSKDLHGALLAGGTTAVNAGPPPVLVETYPEFTLTWTDGGGAAVPLGLDLAPFPHDRFLDTLMTGLDRICRRRLPLF
jgi:hypothetical protein